MVRSYLSGWTQSVRYAGYDSESLPVMSGYLLGSILGPLMFTVYINDMLLALPSTNVLTYADDVTPTAHSDTEESTTEMLQLLADIVFEWSQHNCLSFNSVKGLWLLVSPMLRPAPVITSPTSEPVFIVSSMPFKKASSLRLFGVQFMENLLRAHKDAIVKKVNSVLGVIWRAGRVANVKAHLRMREAFVKPRLLYCLPI